MMTVLSRKSCTRHTRLLTCSLNCSHLFPDTAKPQVTPVPLTVPTGPQADLFPVPSLYREGTGDSPRNSRPKNPTPTKIKTRRAGTHQ